MSAQSWYQLPRPDDSTIINVPGTETLQLLLIGSGPAVGYGVRTHELGLGGHLARQLSVATGRGIRLQVVADPIMSPERASAHLEARRPDEYDIVIVTLGGHQVMESTPPRSWRRTMVRLLHASKRQQWHIFLLAVPPLGDLTRPPLVLRRAIRRRVERFNRISAQVCRRRSWVTFVPFPKTSVNVVKNANSKMYAHWCQGLMTAIVAHLAQRSETPGSPAASDTDTITD